MTISEMAADVIKTMSLGDSFSKYGTKDLKLVYEFLESVREFHSKVGNSSEAFYLSFRINDLTYILRHRIEGRGPE